MKYLIGILLLIVCAHNAVAEKHQVCNTCPINSISNAIQTASAHDTIAIKEGTYTEFDIIINKPLTLISEGTSILDVKEKGYGLIIKADSVSLLNIRIQNVGKSYTKDFAAIYVSKSNHFMVKQCVLTDVFFGLLIEKSHYGVIENNDISSHAVEESSSGNGIHMWYCSNLLIKNNDLHNLRDGIYLEFTSESTIVNNKSYNNLRYGLHFMFSNNDDYHYNTFTKNGAGVAVMFSKHINMTHNVFTENWGSASYGLLLKEINDTEISDNIFKRNTVGINAEGATRVVYKNNDFISNGWALKISGACYTNNFKSNNFENNSFDVSYNSKVNDNLFDFNYWSSYTGYDLDKDGIGDVPFRPVKLFSYIVNRTPETILLLRSLFMELLNFSEKVSPVFTPDNLMDNHPKMKKCV